MNLGPLEIKIKNISPDDENSHKKFINDFKLEVSNKGKGLKEGLAIININHLFFKHVFENISSQIQFLYDKLKDLKFTFQNILVHMENNNKKTLFYYISESINILKELRLIYFKQSIFDTLNIYSIDFRDIDFEKNILADFTLLINKIQNIINIKHSAIYLKFDLIIYDR